MTYLTGAYPDTRLARERDRSEFAFASHAPLAASGLWMQPIAPLRNQRRFPSCTGQALAAAIDAMQGATAPLVSAVSIWREARRRQGRIAQVERGTRFQYALSGLVARGWDPYVPGEDADAKEAGQQDDLADELFADDKRFTRARRYRICSEGADRIDEIASALSNPRIGIVVGAYLRQEFFGYRQEAKTAKDVTLQERCFGGGDNSHGMRVFAVQRLSGGRRRVALQNSWGAWGGLVLPDGKFVPGCAWVDENAIGDSDCTHDVHCIEVCA